MQHFLHWLVAYSSNLQCHYQGTGLSLPVCHLTLYHQHSQSVRERKISPIHQTKPTVRRHYCVVMGPGFKNDSCFTECHLASRNPRWKCKLFYLKATKYAQYNFILFVMSRWLTWKGSEQGRPSRGIHHCIPLSNTPVSVGQCVKVRW